MSKTDNYDLRRESLRIRNFVAAPIRQPANYVLYWMTSQRRLTSNFALDHARAWCEALKLPLLIVEALRCDYTHASPRFHGFVIDGMREHVASLQARNITYFPYIEEGVGDGRGLIEALASEAAVVVVDDHPSTLFVRQHAKVCSSLDLLVQGVDSCGLMPRRMAEKAFLRAHDFRRFVAKSWTLFADDRPRRDPLARANVLKGATIPERVLARWTPWCPISPTQEEGWLRTLPLNGAVSRVVEVRGGHRSADTLLRDFLRQRIVKYGEQRQHPDENLQSGLSPFLHFGHIGAHDILDALIHEFGMPAPLASGVLGHENAAQDSRWGLPPGADAFLDQLLVWRELAFNLATFEPRYEAYESLPAWARASLAQHQHDARPYLYSLEELEGAQTHDPLWNAAARQLRVTGTIHNYLRMLWGKQVIMWSATPQEAFERLVLLNDRYALDGRDPNSYAGIGWVFGRFDRPWAPQRPVLGAIRCMTSQSAQRKLRLKKYMQEWDLSQQVAMRF
jgi:deoxyribodipyrimidine photo-lyase